MKTQSRASKWELRIQQKPVSRWNYKTIAWVVGLTTILALLIFGAVALIRLYDAEDQYRKAVDERYGPEEQKVGSYQVDIYKKR